MYNSIILCTLQSDKITLLVILASNMLILMELLIINEREKYFGLCCSCSEHGWYFKKSVLQMSEAALFNCIILYIIT